MKLHNYRTTRGFTLIELLVVISIISLLASVLLASVRIAQAKARDSHRVQDVTQFKTALELHSLDRGGKYPIVPSSLSFTSTGVITRPTSGNSASDPLVCGSGSSWDEGVSSLSSEDQSKWNTFSAEMSKYISKLPEDPGSKSDNCYVYVSNEDGTVAALVTTYESPDKNNQHVGIVTGDSSKYSSIVNAPAIAIVIGSGDSVSGDSVVPGDPPACNDPLANNYDANATNADGCTYETYGCTDNSKFNYDSTATMDDGSCVPFIYGCTDSGSSAFDPDANTNDGSCVYVTYGCTDPNATNFDPHADLLPTWGDNPCTYPVPGCTDQSATNYDSSATVDDGSCQYISLYGCTDQNATNYDPSAQSDDGSCQYP